jgi:MFS family permease
MTAPLIFAMPIAGAFADRHDRRQILVRANLALALLSGAIVTLLLLHRLSLPLAVLLLAGYALAGSFHGAAFDSGYGLLVPPEKLARANALMMTFLRTVAIARAFPRRDAGRAARASGRLVGAAVVDVVGDPVRVRGRRRVVPDRGDRRGDDALSLASAAAARDDLGRRARGLPLAARAPAVPVA